MRFFLIPIFIIGVLFWAIFGYLVWTIPPKIDGQLVVTNVLYTVLTGAFSLWSTTTLVHYLIGSFFLPKVRGIDQTNPAKRLLLESLRRGFLLSTAVSGLVILNVFEIINLLNVSLILGIAVLIEIYFANR
jgi:hypothetical protein